MAKEGFDSPHWNRSELRVTAARGYSRVTGWQVCLVALLALLCIAPAAYTVLGAAVAPAAAVRG
jgi:hypothetical protein